MDSSSERNKESIHDQLESYIQDRSAKDLDKFITENFKDRGEFIRYGFPTTTLATCDTTIQRKIELGESPEETLRVLQQWGCNQAEQEHEALRTLLCWPPIHVDFVQTVYPLIEFFLDNVHCDVQQLDCRAPDHGLPLWTVTSPNDIDYCIHLTFQAINKQRLLKRNSIANELRTVFVIGPFPDIVADYLYSPYQFKYDESHYDSTGYYKDSNKSCEMDSLCAI